MDREDVMHVTVLCILALLMIIGARFYADLDNSSIPAFHLGQTEKR